MTLVGGTPATGAASQEAHDFVIGVGGVGLVSVGAIGANAAGATGARAWSRRGTSTYRLAERWVSLAALPSLRPMVH